MTTPLQIKKLHPNATIPTYGTEYSAGADLYACLDDAITILPGETAFIPTGLALEIPTGYAGLIYARSGLSCKQGLAPANKVGVIDADYRGEILVALLNHGTEPRQVKHADRIAQIIITPFVTAVFEEVTELSDTSRGEGGFGSTGSH